MSKSSNKQKLQGGKCDLTSCDFRHRSARTRYGGDFGNAYFRASDLRGIVYFKARLEGASLNGARISGAFFSAELNADEITLSAEHGTRMRYGK